MEATPIIPWVFAAMTLIGVLYFMFTIFTGSDVLGDVHVPGLDFGDGFGFTVLAVFFAGFGSIGLLGSLAGWGLGMTLIAALIFGLVLGRAALWLLRWVFKQQSGAIVNRETDLLGVSGRVTIEVPEGKTGEVMIEGQFVQRYPIKEMNGVALKRGDQVEVVDMNGGILYVKKKRI